MPSNTQIQNTLLSARLLMANMVLTNVNAETGGDLNVDWHPATRYYLNIKALQRQFNLGDYISANTVAIYDCLNTLMGYNIAPNVIDPNYHIPGSIINIVTPVSVFNESGPIYFNLTVSPYVLTISNWQTNYYPLYGDKPALLMIVTVDNSSGQPVWTQDTATVPTYSFVGNDPGQHTTDITWTFGAPTSGYILIGGLKP